jgi:opacity protein-like surface antigen
MMKKWLIALLGSAALATSAGALAQKQQAGTGFYIGGDVGNADFGNDDDTSIKILGGYQINRNFAAEVGYSQLFDKGGAEVTAFELVGVGMYPLGNQFSLLGKLGLARINVDTAAGSRDKTELTFGVGVQYDLNPKFGLRGQWQRYDTDPDSVDVLSIGVIYKF